MLRAMEMDGTAFIKLVWYFYIEVNLFFKLFLFCIFSNKYVKQKKMVKSASLFSPDAFVLSANVSAM